MTSTTRARLALASLTVAFAALASSLFALRASAAAPMLETAGFHTGMTFQEAMARLKAYRPALEIKTQQRQIPELGPGYMVSMIYASTPSSNTPNADAERINLSISYLPNTPSVLGIDRDVIYSDKSAPTIVDTVAALRAKYGREMLGFGSRQIYWGWDEAGRPIGEVQMRACGAFVGLSYMMNEESEINRPAPIPSNAHVCAKSHLIMANIVPADNPALVHALSIMMTDVGLGIDSMTRSREVRMGVQQKGASDAVKRAGQNKPKL